VGSGTRPVQTQLLKKKKKESVCRGPRFLASWQQTTPPSPSNYEDLEADGLRPEDEFTGLGTGEATSSMYSTSQTIFLEFLNNLEGLGTE
jgi:hypothetical protein